MQDGYDLFENPGINIETFSSGFFKVNSDCSVKEMAP